MLFRDANHVVEKNPEKKMFKCIKRSKAKLQFPRGTRSCGNTERLGHPLRVLWAGHPLPAQRHQANPGARRVFLCTGRQSGPLFAAPAADGAALADKGGHRHLVAAAGRGAHSFAGAWGQERRQPRKLGSSVAVGPHPAGVMAESRRPAPCPLPARRAESHAPQEGAVRRAELGFCSRGDPTARSSACGAPGIPALAIHRLEPMTRAPALHPVPFLKLRTISGVRHQGLDRPQQPRWQDHGSGNRIPTMGFEPKTTGQVPHPGSSLEPRTPALDTRSGLEPRTSTGVAASRIRLQSRTPDAALSLRPQPRRLRPILQPQPPGPDAHPAHLGIARPTLKSWIKPVADDPRTGRRAAGPGPAPGRRRSQTPAAFTSPSPGLAPTPPPGRRARGLRAGVGEAGRVRAAAVPVPAPLPSPPAPATAAAAAVVAVRPSSLS